MDRSKILDAGGKFIGFPASLAMVLGPTGAMVLTHLYQWISYIRLHDKQSNFHEGSYWYRHTIDQWQADFPFFNEKTIRRTLKDLRDKGIVKVRRDTSGEGWSQTRTLWYTVNGREIDKLCSAGLKELARTKCPDTNRTKSPDAHRTKCPDNNIKEAKIKSTIKPTGKKRRSVTPKKKTNGSTPSAEAKKSEARAAHREKYAKRFHDKKTVPSVQSMWNLFVSQYYPEDKLIGWQPGDSKNTTGFITWCDSSGIDLLDFMEWAIANWKSLSKKKELKWANIGAYPIYRNFYGLRDKFVTLYLQRQKGDDASKTLTKYTDIAQVPKDHPNYRAIKILIELNGEALG